jgi:3-isopropylmalate/(R)-2-methylmalate dehydratase small subunit
VSRSLLDIPPTGMIVGVGIPLGLSNVDTDMILPGDYLKALSRAELADGLFRSLRYDAQGEIREDSIFAEPRNCGAPIILAGKNFGCGSSREHAAWALADFGIRAVIAPSFGEIFAGNAAKNGIAAIELPEQAVEILMYESERLELEIDLVAETVTAGRGASFGFSLDPFRKELLLGGFDEIGLTSTFADQIDRHEAAIGNTRPWVNLGVSALST